MNGLFLSCLVLASALAFASVSAGRHGGRPEGAEGGPGGPGGHHGGRCKGSSVWFNPGSATNGTQCLEALSTATNNTTPFFDDQNLLKLGETFSVCTCCTKTKRGQTQPTTCKLASGATKLVATNVTYV